MLHFTVYSAACSVGTDEYQGVINFLEGAKVQNPIVDLLDTPFTQCSVVNKKVQWTQEAAKDGFFYKIIRYNLFGVVGCKAHGVARGDNWRRLFSVYDKYKSFCDKPGVPNALVSAQLLFGEFQASQLKDWFCCV